MNNKEKDIEKINKQLESIKINYDNIKIPDNIYSPDIKTLDNYIETFKLYSKDDLNFVFNKLIYYNINPNNTIFTDVNYNNIEILKKKLIERKNNLLK